MIRKARGRGTAFAKRNGTERLVDPGIQPVLPLSGRVALECPPAREGVLTRQNDPVSVIEPDVGQSAGPPAWSCLAQGDEQLPQREEEWRGLPDPQIPTHSPFFSSRCARTAGAGSYLCASE